MVAPIETQLRLEKFEENLYRSTEKLWKPPNARGVFGGVVIAQSLMAAAHTLKFGVPVIHHQSKYPGQPMPREVGAESFPNSPFSPKSQDEQEVANGIKVKIILPEKDEWKSQDASERRLRYWMKCDGTISDPKAHVMGLAYLSDSHLLGTSVIASGHRFSDVSMMVSLDHSIYFHHPVKADEWLMHCIESPWSGQERGLVVGRFYNQDKVHIATVVQEGLLRLSDKAKSKKLAQAAKL
ncbi:hypothetical protein DS838_001698 [Geotrichum bryndzae]|nr:hypothetical protein DS838_001698 [Geotrichum bryndzae]